MREPRNIGKDRVHAKQRYGSRVMTAEEMISGDYKKENSMDREREAGNRSRLLSLSKEARDRRHLRRYSRLGHHCIRPYHRLVDDRETSSSQRQV